MYYYWNLTKSYVVAFSSLFKNIQVKRYNEDGTINKTIEVPLTWAGKRKISYYLQEDTMKISTTLPRIGFIMNGMTYAPNRKLNTMKEIELSDSSKEMFEGVPYDLNFTLSVLTKYEDDMLQIVEQILPRFTPDVCVSVNEIPELGISRDVQITLNSVTPNSQYEFSEEEDRYIAYDFIFTLPAVFYPPTSNSNIITEINANVLNLETQQLLTNINHQWNELTESIDTTFTEG